MRAVLAVAALGLLVGCATPRRAHPGDKVVRALPPPARGEMVSVDGTRFVVGDRPVHVVGVNAAAVHGTETREAMPRLFEALGHNHTQVARVWALGLSEGPEAWREAVAFRTGPQTWATESFEHLDAVLTEARQHNVRVILVLANRWSDRGGLPQYARWAGIEPRGRNLMPSELAATLASERARALYAAHLDRVVGRVHAITGKRYADDPAIFSWELINELSASTCHAQEALLDWVDTMAQRVHALDGRHLVAAGHIGYNSPQSLAFWEQVHRLPSIDYADTHGYPQNLLDATSEAAFAAWLDHRAARARRLGRPLLVGEAGIPRDDARFSSRVAWLRPFFERAAANGTDGVLLWMARPWPSGDDPHGIWAWGPRAEETAPVWEMLSERAKAAAREVADEPPAGDDPEWPLGIDRVAAWPEGEWEGESLTADPWAVAEGCARGEEAWLRYAVPWRDDLGAVEVSFSPPLAGAVRVLFDGRLAGTLRDGAFEPSGEAPPRGDLVWLRLVADDEAGAESLARFTHELPGEARLMVRRVR